MVTTKAVTPNPPRARADGQVTGLAGELFVAAELLKRQLQTSLTLGNAKAIDLFAYNPSTAKTFTVQVKALRRTNYFVVNPSRVMREHIYVFVLLNAPGQPVEYFIVPGEDLLQTPEKFGQYFTVDCSVPGIHPNILNEQGYKNAWGPFMV